MSQFEQENDLGRGGGEVGDDEQDAAWRRAEERIDRDFAEDPAEGADWIDEDVQRRS